MKPFGVPDQTLWCSKSKNCFTNLKKKYSKKKNDLKWAKGSAAGLADIQKFEKQLDNYSFLDWLNHFLKLKNDTRSNWKDDDDNTDSSSNEEDEKNECLQLLMTIQVECQT